MFSLLILPDKLKVYIKNNVIFVGSMLVNKFFTDLSQNAFATFDTVHQTDINGLFMVISALFKNCGD